MNSYLDQIGSACAADPARHPQARLLPDPQAAARAAARLHHLASSTRRWPRSRWSAATAGSRADLPFRTDKELKIPAWVYRPYWRDLDPYVEVESVTWQRGNLVIAGLAYVPSIDISKRRYTNKIVILRPRRKFRPPIVSLASSWRHPRATQISGQERYDYAWAGFRSEISPAGSGWPGGG